MNRVAHVILVVLLASCAPNAQVPPDLAAPAEDLVWPPPPEAPRIKFLYAFRDPGDLGLRPTVFERLWNFVAGEEDRAMVRPYAVVERDDLIAVADPGAKAVHLYDRSDQSYRRVIGAGEHTFISPVGVALGPERLYIADSAAGKIFGFGRQGDLMFAIGHLDRPTSLAYDAASNRLYATDTLGHKVVVFDPKGNEVMSFGGRGTGDSQFNYPTHLAIRDSKLYVNDTMNFRVQVFDLDGTFRGSFGSHGDGSGDFAQPKGIGVDAEGHVYVTDAVFDRVQVFDPGGRFLLAFGGAGPKAGRFWLPSGLFIAQDRIYVADSYNRRVQVFQFLGGG